MCLLLFFRGDYFTKGLSYSERFFVHNLVYSLSLTPVYSTQLKAAVWIPWCDESDGWNCMVEKMTSMSLPAFLIFLGMTSS